MNVEVKLFAAARQYHGDDSILLELPTSVTVGELRSMLAEHSPQLVSLLSTSMIAVDHQYAADDQEIAPSSEVALIPPVSGG